MLAVNRISVLDKAHAYAKTLSQSERDHMLNVCSASALSGFSNGEILNLDARSVECALNESCLSAIEHGSWTFRGGWTYRALDKLSQFKHQGIPLIRRVP